MQGLTYFAHLFIFILVSDFPELSSFKKDKTTMFWNCWRCNFDFSISL